MGDIPLVGVCIVTYCILLLDDPPFFTTATTTVLIITTTTTNNEHCTIYTTVNWTVTNGTKAKKVKVCSLKDE